MKEGPTLQMTWGRMSGFFRFLLFLPPPCLPSSQLPPWTYRYLDFTQNKFSQPSRKWKLSEKFKVLMPKVRYSKGLDEANNMIIST